MIIVLRINNWEGSIVIEGGKAADDDESPGPPVIGRPELIEVPTMEGDDDDDEPEGLGFRARPVQQRTPAERADQLG